MDINGFMIIKCIKGEWAHIYLEIISTIFSFASPSGEPASEGNNTSLWQIISLKSKTNLLRPGRAPVFHLLLPGESRR